MSDATPAAAPVAPSAPTETANTATPKVPQETKPPVEVDPKAELEAALKKLGGIEVKAGGKAHKVDSLEKLVRYAQRGLPVEQSLEEVARQKSELEPFRNLIQQLQAGDEDAAEAALEKLLDSGKLDKVAERRLRRQFEKEQQLEGLTEREKAYARELEQQRAEMQRIKAEADARKQQETEQLEARQVKALENHIGGVMVEALKALDLGEKLDPVAMVIMKPLVASALRAGLPLDPAMLADKVRPVLEAVHGLQMRNLKGEALINRLGPEGMKEVKAYLLAQLNGGAAQPAPVTQTEAKPSSGNDAKWDPRRMYR